MKNVKLLAAIGSIRDVYIEEALPEAVKIPVSKKLKRSAVAACIVMAAAAVLYPFCAGRASSPSIVRRTAGQGNSLPSIQKFFDQRTAGSKTDAVDSSAETRLTSKGDSSGSRLAVTNLSSPPADRKSNFALFTKDFIRSSTDNELFRYYGVTLPVEKVFPSLKQQHDASHGIYKNAVRGVYYDTNSFSYAASDGTRKVAVALAKGKPPLFDFNEAYSHKLAQSVVSGVTMTIARYAQGHRSIDYAEFIRSGTGYSVSAEGFSECDFYGLLTALAGAQSPSSSN